MNRTGASNALIAVLIIAAALVGAAGWAVFGGQQETASVVQEDFDGEFDQIQPLQDVTGTDLTVTEQTLNESGIVSDANVVFAYQMNNTDGQLHEAATGFEVSGAVGETDIDVSLTDAATVDETNVALRHAYLIEDNEDSSLDRESAAYVLDVEDQNEVDQTVPTLADGDWILTLGLKSLDTGGIATGANLYTVEVDADTDGDNDNFAYDIDNAAQ